MNLIKAFQTLEIMMPGHPEIEVTPVLRQLEATVLDCIAELGMGSVNKLFSCEYRADRNKQVRAHIHIYNFGRAGGPFVFNVDVTEGCESTILVQVLDEIERLHEAKP